MKIGFTIYPGLTQLDVAGPAQVLSQLPGTEILMIAEKLAPITTDSGFTINPTHDFDSAPQVDIICAPGGPGQGVAMSRPSFVAALAKQAAGARYVTGVCTGSLLLGKAGLMQGYKAACHWAWRDRLTDFGAIPIAERIVKDRNRITGGGVTAGIDFAFALLMEIAGEEVARMIQLSLEYAPAPPLTGGTPETAGPELTAAVRKILEANFKIVSA
jgi:cyclohexyl-isocyanide hydratase